MEDVIVIGEMPGAEKASDAVTIEDAAASPLPKRAMLQDDGTVVLPLLYPVTLTWKPPGNAPAKEDRFDTLTMRRLTGRDMTLLGNASRGDSAMVSISLSSGIKQHIFRHVFDRMDAADITAAAEVVSYFLSSGPTTGR